MNEKQKKKEQAPSLGGGNPFGQSDGKHATVCSGLYQEQLPVAGMSVGEVRKEFSSRLEISDDAVCTINGVEVDNNHKIGANEMLLFIQQAGEKG